MHIIRTKLHDKNKHTISANPGAFGNEFLRFFFCPRGFYYTGAGMLWYRLHGGGFMMVNSGKMYHRRKPRRLWEWFFALFFYCHWGFFLHGGDFIMVNSGKKYANSRGHQYCMQTNNVWSCLALCLCVASVLLAFWLPCLGKRKLVFVSIVHLFVSYAHVNLCHFFTSSWCQGLAATSACGSSLTFLFAFFCSKLHDQRKYDC